jgi:signal transduction histidine kinase
MSKQRFQLPPAGKFKQLNAQDSFAIVHELLTPLDNIHLSIEMLNTLSRNSEEQVYLDVIERSTTRLYNSLNAYLFSSRPEQLSSDESSMHHLLNEVLAIADDRITRKQIVISREYSAPDNKIVLNRPAVKIAILNIIMTAIDAMKPAEGELKLITELINGKYVLRIKGNGPGTSVHGLATAFYILRSNFIGIDVESNEDCGTNFILIFRNTATSPMVHARPSL